MPKLRLVKDDPSLADIIPFPLAQRLGRQAASSSGDAPGVARGSADGSHGLGPDGLGYVGGRFSRHDDGVSARDIEHELLGTIDRMQQQLGELSDMLGPIPLFPDDDRPRAA